ncbi:MAG: hypothetical protein KDE51_05620 [Anaerolineales bacterium]|nr:hypothetical protein [Anaerolineales bacterium]
MKTLIFTIALAISILTTSLAVASPSAVSDLPERPTPMPPTTTTANIDGGQIILQVNTSDANTADLWTIVQWQGVNNTWHDVEGWQGNINSGDQVVWWVDNHDLDTGPFRWRVYDSEARTELLATSDSFDLPAQSGQQTTVTVVLP